MSALKGKRKLLTTKESNESRYVTKIRWVVEAVHGILMQKLLDHKLDNKMLPKVASFLYNQFGEKLKDDAEFATQILERMRVRKNLENTLATEVEEKG